MVVFFTLLCNGQMQAQFLTRVLAPDDHIGNHIPWYMPDRTVIVDAPYIDVESVLEQDRINKREMPRVGIPQEVNYSLQDGQFYFSDKYTIWNFTLRSRGAKAMSIRLDNSRLPEDAVMFVYNEENRFVSSPLSHKDFKDGMFRSDYMNGDQITLSVYIPSVDLALFQMNVSTYDHSVQSSYAFDSQFEASEPCHRNVACSEGNGWECEIDAVCKIVHSDIGYCTGTLINNGCCDLTSYILTANHCAQNEATEAFYDIDDYVYRFNYQSPQCSPNGETSPGQWIVYVGSDLRANWNYDDGTDFGLLELFDNIDYTLGDVSFAGWNREVNPPTDEVVSIHHPLGDVKKISVNSDGVTTQGDYWIIEQ
ncbi:MAG: trypsin-like serine peptidase [Chitinophagales bacterium]